MRNISASTKSYFIYFISYANVVLNCKQRTIKEIFPNNSYCEKRYYNREDDVYGNELEIRLANATLSCCFDETGRCDVCHVFFDDTDNVSTYVELCNQLFDYCPIKKRWKLYSGFIVCFEGDNNRYFSIFANR